MRMKSEWTPGWLTLRFEPDVDDPIERGKTSLSGNVARLALPDAFGPDDLHPDLEALIGLLLVQPFTRRSLVVDRPVSPVFAAAALGAMRRDVGAVDRGLAPRPMPANGRPGLAFSGGSDSIAALSVLPETAVPVFLRRITPDGAAVRSLYRDEAAVHACAELSARHGFEVATVESDIEYLRTPIGFPTDWANALGAVLLADRFNLDSISWGLVAESAYRIGHEEYQDWATRRTAWAAVFEAAGLHFTAPVAGVSEVGTAAIVAASPYRDLAQSCIRGSVGIPCRNCWKCFRKSLLEAAIESRWPSDDELDALFRIPEVGRKLNNLPIAHENVIAWLVARYPGRHPKMAIVRQRVGAGELQLDYLQRWYGPSAALFPARHGATITARLDGYLDRMGDSDVQRFRAWTMHKRLAGRATKRSAEALRLALTPDAGDGQPSEGRLSRVLAAMGR